MKKIIITGLIIMVSFLQIQAQRYQKLSMEQRIHHFSKNISNKPQFALGAGVTYFYDNENILHADTTIKYYTKNKESYGFHITLTINGVMLAVQTNFPSKPDPNLTLNNNTGEWEWKPTTVSNITNFLIGYHVSIKEFQITPNVGYGIQNTSSLRYTLLTDTLGGAELRFNNIRELKTKIFVNVGLEFSQRILNDFIIFTTINKSINTSNLTLSAGIKLSPFRNNRGKYGCNTRF